MSDPPQVSVILPTYNRSRTLGRAIASVLAQTWKDFELIVVDDGSTDDTAQVVASHADQRVVYHRCKSNRGVSSARNLGIKLARGEWLAFQDSDDEWRVEKLQSQVLALREGGANVALVVCGNLCIDEYSMSYLGIDSESTVVDVTKMAIMRLPGAPCWLVPKTVLHQTGGFNELISCFEDWELALRLSDQGRILFVNQPLHLVHKTPGSLFADEHFSQNLKRIMDLHRLRFVANPDAWAFYSNLIGQTDAQFGDLIGARRWFINAIRARPTILRSWLNLLMSLLGKRAFKVYLQWARKIRGRYAAPVRPALRGEHA